MAFSDIKLTEFEDHSIIIAEFPIHSLRKLAQMEKFNIISPSQEHKNTPSLPILSQKAQLASGGELRVAPAEATALNLP